MRRRRSGRIWKRRAAGPVACASASPTSAVGRKQSIRRSQPPCATWPGCSRKLGHHVEERAPKLPANPADVKMMKITGAANTALSVRLAEAQFGRKMAEADFEHLTLASAVNAGKTGGVDYVEAQLAAFQISRTLAEFFAGVDVFLSPTLCQPPLKLGVLDTMGDLKNISPVLGEYMPGTSMFNMSGQPAMSVPLAWNAAGLPLGIDVRGEIRRRGDAVTAGGATGSRAAVEGSEAGSVRVSPASSLRGAIGEVGCCRLRRA